MSLLVEYTDRRGKVHRYKAMPDELRQTLAYLDSVEAETQRSAPTDSGDTRFSYNAEARAIRAALANVPRPMDLLNHDWRNMVSNPNAIR